MLKVRKLSYQPCQLVNTINRLSIDIALLNTIVDINKSANAQRVIMSIRTQVGGGVGVTN